jgi:hypothetical protein
MMHAAALVYGSPACRNGGSGNRARLQRLSHQHERNPKLSAFVAAAAVIGPLWMGALANLISWR